MSPIGRSVNRLSAIWPLQIMLPSSYTCDDDASDEQEKWCRLCVIIVC